MMRDWFLLRLVRLNAAIVLLAAPCALLPHDWMEAIHRDVLGLGSFPDAAITSYMARSLCLLYALHGAMILIVTRDWPRHRSLVPPLAWLHIGFGSLMVVQDWSSGMPWWWVLAEGPTIIAFALVVLWASGRVRDGRSPKNVD